MEGSNCSTPDNVHESVRRGVNRFLTSFLLDNVIDLNKRFNVSQSYRKVIEGKLWTLTNMMVSPNLNLVLDFFKTEGPNIACPEFHQSVRKGVHRFLTSFLNDIDYSDSMKFYVPRSYQMLVEDRLWTLTDVMVSPDPRLFRDSFYKSDMEYLYAVDGLRCKDYHPAVRGDEKLLTERQPTEADQQRTCDWKWYTDNARYPVCHSTPVQTLPKSLLEDPMEAHCHAVRRMYQCLYNPVEISSALSRFYKRKCSTTTPDRGEKSNEADDESKVCVAKNQLLVTLGQEIYFKTLGGDVKLMGKIAENLGLQVCSSKEFASLKNDLKSLPRWENLVLKAPIASCGRMDCLLCGEYPSMRQSVYLDLKFRLLDVDDVALEREKENAKLSYGFNNFFPPDY